MLKMDIARILMIIRKIFNRY